MLACEFFLFLMKWSRTYSSTFEKFEFFEFQEEYHRVFGMCAPKQQVLEWALGVLDCSILKLALRIENDSLVLKAYGFQEDECLLEVCEKLNLGFWDLEDSWGVQSWNQTLKVEFDDKHLYLLVILLNENRVCWNDSSILYQLQKIEVGFTPRNDPESEYIAIHTERTILPSLQDGWLSGAFEFCGRFDLNKRSVLIDFNFSFSTQDFYLHVCNLFCLNPAEHIHEHLGAWDLEINFEDPEAESTKLFFQYFDSFPFITESRLKEFEEFKAHICNKSP